MNKKQAIEAMLGGAKVRGLEWGNGEYIVIRENGDFVDEEGNTIGINGFHFEGWEIYEEPKAPVIDFDKIDEVLSMVFGIDVSKLMKSEGAMLGGAKVRGLELESGEYIAMVEPKSKKPKAEEPKAEERLIDSEKEKKSLKILRDSGFISADEFAVRIAQNFGLNPELRKQKPKSEEPKDKDAKSPEDIYKELLDFLSSEISNPNIAEPNFGLKIGDGLYGGTITKIENGKVCVEMVCKPEPIVYEIEYRIHENEKTEAEPYFHRCPYGLDEADAYQILDKMMSNVSAGAKPIKLITLQKWLCKLEGADGYEIVTASEEYFENVAAVIGVQRVKKLGEETIEIEE